VAAAALLRNLIELHEVIRTCYVCACEKRYQPKDLSERAMQALSSKDASERLPNPVVS
jgi:hypothetical protein